MNPTDPTPDPTPDPIPVLSTNAPSANALSTNAPSGNARSADAPSGNARSADAPSAVVPSAVVPSTEVPSANARSADARSADARSAAVPSTEVPSANARSADAPSAVVPDPPQYTRRQVVAVWAAAALPMAALSWLVAPWIADHLDGPMPLSRALIVTLTVGLAWQAVLVLLLVRREQGTLTWHGLRDGLWLHAPTSPRTGRRGGRVWWMVAPFVVGFGLVQLLPSVPAPASRDMGQLLGSDAGHQLLAGGWGWFAVLVVMALLNTVVGEELLFRGLLLPRMRAVAGRADWLVNGLMFGLYHLHVPWAAPTSMLTDGFLLAYPTRRYRSAWMGIAVHSSQSVVILALALALVLR